MLRSALTEAKREKARPLKRSGFAHFGPAVADPKNDRLPATTAATTAATAATATAATTTSAAAALALFGFVDLEGPSVEERAVHLTHGLLRTLGGAHGHEAEAARLTRLTIRDDVDIGDIAERRESRFSRFERMHSRFARMHGERAFALEIARLRVLGSPLLPNLPIQRFLYEGHRPGLETRLPRPRRRQRHTMPARLLGRGQREPTFE